MDLAIYVRDDASLEKARQAVEALKGLPAEHVARVVDVRTAGHGPVPAQYIQILMKRKERALPLLLVDGEAALSGRVPTAHELVSVLPDDGKRPEVVVTASDSAVEFAGDCRAHVSLNITSIERSLPFYRVLFNAEPSKTKPYYVKFELQDPPLNVTLNERPFEMLKEGQVGHFGLQVKSSEKVAEAKARWQAAGFAVEEEEQTACCYAVQTKVWMGDPDGNRWEVFLTTDDRSDVFCPSDCLCYAEMKPDKITPVVV